MGQTSLYNTHTKTLQYTHRHLGSDDVGTARARGGLSKHATFHVFELRCERVAMRVVCVSPCGCVCVLTASARLQTH
jgi:hypothetical protein